MTSTWTEKTIRKQVISNSTLHHYLHNTQKGISLFLFEELLVKFYTITYHFYLHFQDHNIVMVVIHRLSLHHQEIICVYGFHLIVHCVSEDLMQLIELFMMKVNNYIIFVTHAKNSVIFQRIRKRETIFVVM